MTAPLSLLALSPPKIDYLSILPVLVMLGGAVAILAVSSVLRRRADATWVTVMAVMTALAALSLSLVQWFDVSNHGAHVSIDSAVVEDGFSALVAVLVSSAAFLSALVADGWMRRERSTGPEFQALMLLSSAGAMIMGEANDLIVVFLGLEILSIALYVLAAMNARRAESGEAALKYFVLGAFSSAVFLYGVALVYGATGSTNLPQIADYLARNVLLHNGLLLAGMALLLVGFGFKIAAVPFHLWTPDVYQGSPSPATGFMAAVAKAGGFAALLRVFVSSFATLRSDWQPAVWVLAAITLVLGATVALAQRDIKRMLAYSSINHAGFVLLGLQVATARGVEGSLYYLFTYTFMVIGSFAVITVVGGGGDTRHDLEHYRGLASRRPWLAGSLGILLMAQAGIPFTTGFLAKLEVISASVGGRSTALAVVAMVSAAIAAFFYLRVILLMYSAAPAPAPGTTGGTERASADGARAVGSPVSGSSAAPTADSEPGSLTLVSEASAGSGTEGESAVSPTTVAAIAVCVAVTILFGVWPAPLLDFAHKATLLFG